MPRCCAALGDDLKFVTITSEARVADGDELKQSQVAPSDRGEVRALLALP
jgi:hypothetical protein